MAASITVRFFRVDRRSRKQPKFKACLEMLQALRSDDEREREIAGVRIGSDSLGYAKKVHWGDLLRLQNENLPSIKEKGKPPASLKIPTDSHLGHHTAFIFDEETEMLGYQLTKSSVSMSRFNLYISDICGTTLFDFVPVIEPAELKALANMAPKTFLIKVADPEDLEAVEEDQLEMQRSIKGLKDTVGGAYIKIQVGMGQRKGLLREGRIRSTISWLLEQRAKGRGNVQSLRIEGKLLEGGRADPLNFIKAHIGDTEKILVAGLQPRENFEARLAVLRKSLLNNKETLRTFTREAKT